MGAFAGFMNGILWSTPLPIIVLASGLIFTLMLRVVQVRQIKNMVTLLFNGKASENGLSSFQALCLSIAGRVGTGNIVGVATAIAVGGPGALFWMWVVAILGAATAFVECTMSQLYKEKINGEYRGGAMYYIGKGFNSKLLGGIFAAIFIVSEVAFLSCVQSNAIAGAVDNAFGISGPVIGIIIVALLGYLIFGGAKRLGRAAEMIVPVMALIYVLVSIVVLVAHASELPATFAIIFQSAFGLRAGMGALFGAAIMNGVKRGIYSNESGMSTATPSAGAAEVSHPVKQGLVQSFSVYIDTLLVCTATGLMLIVTGSYNVISDGVDYIVNMPGVDASAVWAQTAVTTVIPFGSEFVAIALFFFAFTTLMNMYYNSETSFIYFFREKAMPKAALVVLRIVYLGFTFMGAIITSSEAWAFGDVGIGLMTWANVVALWFLVGKARALLKDFEEQDKAGIDPVFDPAKFNYPGTELWAEIKEGYDSKRLVN